MPCSGPQVQPGFVRIEYEVASARIRAAYILGPHAGEMISEFTVAIQHALTMHDLAKVIHPSARTLHRRCRGHLSSPFHGRAAPFLTLGGPPIEIRCA